MKWISEEEDRGILIAKVVLLMLAIIWVVDAVVKTPELLVPIGIGVIVYKIIKFKE